MTDGGIHGDHHEYQRRYFAQPERTRPRMAVVSTPYVRRHLAETLAPLELNPGARVLELGCGMGRFTRPLVEAGHRVTAVDLSPDLVAELRATAAVQGWSDRLTVICADSAELPERLAGSARDGAGLFDAVVGFFFLHHLPELGPTFAATAQLLRPGGGAAFCEPNAFYLPYYAQILLTPGMTWAGDRGISRMRAGRVSPALRRAGFIVPPPKRYGQFPPALANRAAGRRVERWLERVPLPRAFQVFHGELPAPRVDGAGPAEGEGRKRSPSRAERGSGS